MMTESLGDCSESLSNFFLRFVGVLGFGTEASSGPACCDMPMYCILGDRERLRVILDSGAGRTRALLRGGDTSKKDRGLSLGGERRTTDESKPLEIEMWDLRVELEDTEMTSWPSIIGGALAAFF
jgi:hypothetical protein